MTQLAFKAHCAKGHERVDFTDRDAFVAHMADAHKVQQRKPGGADDWTGTANQTAPGWRNGVIEKPYPREAPKASRGGLEKVAKDLEAGKYDVCLTYTGPTTRMGEVA